MTDIYGNDLKKYEVFGDLNGHLVGSVYYAASEAEAFCAFVADYPCAVVQRIEEANKARS